MTDKTSPATLNQTELAVPSSSAGITAFLDQVRALGRTQSGGRGRLIFALDATGSREPTWSAACRLQADMFRAAAAAGGLDIQLVYYRGIGECQASGWIAQADRLADLMTRIECRAGETQIGRVLSHAIRETRRAKVHALVFVGDALEEEVDRRAASAGELGLLGVPAFVFQEGGERGVEQAFREIARLTRGAYCRFAPGAEQELAQLLRAVAVYAAGGVAALAAQKDAGARLLLAQLK